MRKHAYLLALPLLILTFIVLFFAKSALSATAMPRFKLPDVITGEMVDSKELNGTSMLVTFFATWCPPCIQEIPNLIELQNEYSSRNFSVIGMSVDQGEKVVKNLVTKKGINYPVMMADDSVTRNFGGVYGIPTSFLVNSKGNVVKKYTGYVPHSVLVRDIKQIIN
ncbi:MAG: TlpA family protein disulfide reductase [Desulfobacterales bacterium]|nr:TlpA family protein disulfide reductase [Deltaproteobacteria bacterium]NNK96757.1 TlpA family protein disulfide reductase [Desulfobacterales bacterium]